ncbi:hypothetical protein DFO70_12913 [Cytobacillus firmus]|uniref:Uncharacterized protein n=2 Tax=Cytobacillus TaxID=2675230 RepID=A0A366JK67_CYTFI|nr:hypothetical protein DFO70_12913 [Cytobacillus firmus]TDX35885.1 hypothetical protein DFO72_12513 [Cytobacillus oceanisediminis]
MDKLVYDRSRCRGNGLQEKNFTFQDATHIKVILSLKMIKFQSR